MHEHASAAPEIAGDDVTPSPERNNLYDRQISAIEWYGATAVRRRVRAAGTLGTSRQPGDARAQMLRLERTGYMQRVGSGVPDRGEVFALTDEGHHTLDWAGAPKPTFMDERQHAAELARAIALHYRVPVHAMLRTATGGNALLARARLSAALRARGWSFGRIAGQFGMVESRVRAAAERWTEHRARVAAIRAEAEE